MSHNTLPTVAELSGEMRERLAKVKYVFTDLDATMLAPGSCVLRDNDGNPSTKLVEAVVALARAGIQVVPTSGRNRTMIHEDARVLGLNSYIGEMGGLVMYDLKANDWEYLTGDMPYDPSCGLTPHQVIEQTGVCEKILARWPHKIEYHNDMSTGYKYREVTVGMRGDIPDDEAQAILDEAGCGLVWACNGHLTHLSKPTTLELDRVEDGRAFNINPAGLNKGVAIARFCEHLGIEREETLALGDSESDFYMADHVGTFCLVENGLTSAGAPEFLAARETGEVMSDIENPAGDTRPIGVFDSGLGGLTVARAIATALPHESVYYFGDTKRCPYGTRTEDEVRSFALQAGRWLSKHDVKIMVIACNTATAAALRLAQQVLDVPVIGVIAPGARAAINSTRTRRVGVLATNLTIRSGAYTRAIQDLDAGVDVYGCPASSFVEVVEHELASGAHLQEQWLENEDIFDTPAVRALVGATVEPLRDHGIDTVVLGCTHFPLLVGPIRHALGPGVRVVSSAEETTRELTDILTRREQLAGVAAEPQHRFATTADNIAEFAVAGSFIFGQPLKSIEHIDIDELK